MDFDIRYIQPLNKRIDTLLSETENKFDFPKIDFSKSDELVKSAIGAGVSFIYKKDYEDLCNGYARIAEYVRKIMLFGASVLIYPPLAIPVYIADKLIEAKVNEKEAASMCKKYQKEINTTKNLIDTVDSKTKRENLQKYLLKLEDGSYKIEKYAKSIGVEAGTPDAYSIDFMDENLNTFKDALCEYDKQLQYNLLCSTHLDECDKELLYEYSTLQHNKNNYNVSEGGVKHVIGNAKRTDSKISNKIDKVWFTTIDDVKKSLIGDKREDIIRNNIPKLSKLIKKAAITGAVALINPTIALIGASTAFCLGKYASGKERVKLLNDLKLELEIVEEKIRDSEQENDKQKKYQLMRLRNEINKDIERIRYNLNA